MTQLFKVFVFGISGGVGRLLARSLTDRGDVVCGLVRRGDQRVELVGQGADAYVGEITDLTVDSLTAMIGGFDAVVYAAGSNAGAREVTAAIDGDGVLKALEAASRAGVKRFVLLSVLPEAERGRPVDDVKEYYFAVKKLVDVTVSESDLDWLILRPSMLVDRPGTGAIALGPAQPHDEIPREDVAATLTAVLHEPRIGRQILELNQGSTPIAAAVRANLR